MGKNFFKFKWISLFAVFLLGQFFLNGPAYADWTVVSSADNWELFNIRFPWAVGQGQNSQGTTGVLLYFTNGRWFTATLPNVSTDWALSGVDLTSSSKGWAVGQDSANKKGVLIYFANPVVANLPSVTTSAVSNITATTATGGGNVTSDGGTPVTARGVCWDTSANPAVGPNCTSDGTGTGIFTSSITDLTASTLYHIRAYATNSLGTGYGDDFTFTTTALAVPTVTTTDVTNVTDTTATGGGNVTSDGGTPVTARGVCWDTSPNPVVGPNCTSDGTGTGSFISSIADLTANTQYFVRAYATNSTGTGYGNDVTFTTTASTTSTLTLSTSKSTPISNITAAAASGSGLVWPILSVIPPNVSSNWGLSAVHFFSSDEGWAVGQDSENGRGVMLYFSDGSWASVIVPDVSSNWGLSSVHFIWAVGRDSANGRGVILRFSGGVPWTLVPPLLDVGSSDWGLSAVRLVSPQEAWAVGQDFENGTGVLLHFLNGSWTSVSPPPLVVSSSNWGLSSVDFSSSNEGWAVGQDITNGTGVLLHYVKMPGEDVGSWTSVSVSPLGVTGNWGLTGIDLITAFSGWAVGQTSDGTNTTGVLLRYTAPQISVSPTSIDFKKVETGAFLEKTVTVKNTGNENLVIGDVSSPSPPFYKKIPDSCSEQTLAPSQACKITYGFLPESVNFFPDSSNIPSNSAQNPVTVALKGTGVQGTAFNSINVLGPPDGGTYTACDYADGTLPTFQWTSSGAFTSIGVQFSVNNDFSGVSLKVNGNLKSNSLSIQKTVWKRVLLLPGANGGTVYWKIIANKKDRTMVESSVYSFTVSAPEPVDNVGISSTSKATLPPPTLSWNSHCNIIFTVWFGNDSNFNLHTKKLSLSFKGNTGSFPLTSSQWTSIRKLVGDQTGATVYWYVQSQDGLGRRERTDGPPFSLTD
jgi:hypothetical protein